MAVSLAKPGPWPWLSQATPAFCNPFGSKQLCCVPGRIRPLRERSSTGGLSLWRAQVLVLATCLSQQQLSRRSEI